MADESTTAAAPADDFDIPAPGIGSDSGGSGGGSGSAPASTPATPPSATPPAVPESSAPPAQPSPLSDFLRAERLPEIPGESPEQTQLRLNAHWQGKSQRFYKEMQAKQERVDALAAAHAEELRMIREAITPMAKDYYARARAEQTAAAAAEIPDRDSPEYSIWLSEQILLRDEQRQADAEAAAASAREEAEAQRVFEYYQQVETAGYDALAAGIQDPEFARDYNTLTQLAYADVVARWPNADPEDHVTFLEIAQRLDVRDWVERGIDPRAGIKERVQRLRSAFGQAAPAPQSAAQPVQQPAPAQPSPTATRMAQEAQDAARRAPVTAAMPSRPVQAAANLPDPSAYESDDDYVEAVLAGILPPEEQRVAAYRKER